LLAGFKHIDAVEVLSFSPEPCENRWRDREEVMALVNSVPTRRIQPTLKSSALSSTEKGIWSAHLDNTLGRNHRLSLRPSPLSSAGANANMSRDEVRALWVEKLKKGTPKNPAGGGWANARSRYLHLHGLWQVLTTSRGEAEIVP
jgi:hypothetical protein